ncbi:DgyrCDS7122 [Dimorphilus gyrociliatus]|uniref:DgyrCDS7122 n=1 Tax=Dimorphilus gyrociliatus TaxID=2664684 RepID=A0A7I8VRV1_9ANNE|nr:DgyrCDS7122 [Dimorphilus gyrociliatus]
MVEQKALPVPPDGGWGWVIVIASHIINIIVDGVCFTFGLFLREFQEHFNASFAKTALIGSLIPGLYLGIGPISSALANKFGVRLISIIGALIASMGFFVCVYSNNINTMIFTYGVLGGVGFGLMYLPSIVIVNFYFDKKRATASGIAVCGSGVGTFIFTFLTEPLVNKYSWKGAMWIISGIVLNACVCASFFRPLEAPKPPKSRRNSKSSVIQESFIMRKITEQKARDRTISTGSTDGMLITKDNRIIKDNEFLSQRNGFEHRAVTTIKEEEENGLSRASSQYTVYSNAAKDKVDPADASRPMYRQDIFFTGSVKSIPEYKSQPNMQSYVASVTSIPQRDVGKRSLCTPAIDTFKTMFDLSLFKSMTFNLVCASALLYMMGFFVPFTYSPAFAMEECGVSESQSKIPLLVMGACNTVGRIIAGWLSDRPWISSMILHNAALLIAGITTMFLPFIKSFIFLNIYSALYGLCVATFIALRSIVLVDLLGVQRLTNAFGILLLFQGIATVIGTPIGGAIKDKTGSFWVVYMYAGATLLGASLIGIVANKISSWERKKDEDNSDSLSREVPSLPSETA